MKHSRKHMAVAGYMNSEVESTITAFMRRSSCAPLSQFTLKNFMLGMEYWENLVGTMLLHFELRLNNIISWLQIHFGDSKLQLYF